MSRFTNRKEPYIDIPNKSVFYPVTDFFRFTTKLTLFVPLHLIKPLHLMYENLSREVTVNQTFKLPKCKHG